MNAPTENKPRMLTAHAPDTVTPIFLLSLPRSGSTLLQCLLAARADQAIDTALETWLLLPLLYPLSDRGLLAEFDQRAMRDVIAQFEERLPDGPGSVRKALAATALRLYSQAAAPNARFFVDKTPPYSVFSPELPELFPTAHFIVLWRNPLAVAASNMRVFGNGRLRLGQQYFEFYRGLDGLHELVEAHGDRVHPVRYEDLVQNPRDTLKSLFEHLGLPDDPDALSRFSQVGLDQADTVADQPGRLRYAALSHAALDAWTPAFRSPVRRQWARRYLASIGDARLRRMGYDRESLLAALPEGGWRHSAHDLRDWMTDALRNRVKHRLLRARQRPAAAGRISRTPLACMLPVALNWESTVLTLSELIA